MRYSFFKRFQWKQGMSRVHSRILATGNYLSFNVMMVVDVPAGETNKAVGWLEASNDGINWKSVARLDIDTVGKSLDGGPFQALYECFRFVIDEAPENAFVTVTMSCKRE